MYRPIRFLPCFLSVAILAVVGCVDSSTSTEEVTSDIEIETETTSLKEQIVEKQEKAEQKVEEPAEEESDSEPTFLDIGSPAPRVQIANWVKGEPITSFDPEKIYVVEFWATWCPPCRTSIPHLSKLQETYGKEVVFIGVTLESEETVQAFLEKEAQAGAGEPGQTWNDLMQYHVAIDAGGATSAAFMEASNQRVIPAAFVVGYDSKIDWIGYPMLIDEPLKSVVERSWDREAYLVERQKEIERKRKLQIQLADINSRLNQAAEAGDWDQALLCLDEVEEVTGRNLDTHRVSMLLGAGRIEGALEVVLELGEKYDKQANQLNRLAWSLITMPNIDTSILREALNLAQRSCELTGYTNANAIDTLARAHFVLGDVEQAISWQQQAVELDPGKAQLQETLEEYQTQQEMSAAGSAKLESSNIEQPAA